MKREEELIKEGWEQRITACDPRLSEVKEMYEEIGLEVHLEPLPTTNGELGDDGNSCTAKECTVCFDADRNRYRIIFTRPGGNK